MAMPITRFGSDIIIRSILGDTALFIFGYCAILACTSAGNSLEFTTPTGLTPKAMSNSLSAEEIDTTRLATLGNDTICFVSSSI